MDRVVGSLGSYESNNDKATNPMIDSTSRYHGVCSYTGYYPPGEDFPRALNNTGEEAFWRPCSLSTREIFFHLVINC